MPVIQQLSFALRILTQCMSLFLLPFAEVAGGRTGGRSDLFLVMLLLQFLSLVLLLFLELTLFLLLSTGHISRRPIIFWSLRRLCCSEAIVPLPAAWTLSLHLPLTVILWRIALQLRVIGLALPRTGRLPSRSFR